MLFLEVNIRTPHSTCTFSIFGYSGWGVDIFLWEPVYIRTCYYNNNDNALCILSLPHMYGEPRLKFTPQTTIWLPPWEIISYLGDSWMWYWLHKPSYHNSYGIADLCALESGLWQIVFIHLSNELQGVQKYLFTEANGRRRRLLDWYGFRFSISLLNVFEIALRVSVLFPVVQMVLWMFDVYCAYGSAHTFSHLNYIKPSCILPSPRLSFARFGWV